ncbi:MAG: hypothetical protein ABUT20_01765 [Bacteroidota bacterium]
MTTELLRKKTGRYLTGLSTPSEKRQIQNWLSCTGENKQALSLPEREIIEFEIVTQVQAYVDSTLSYPSNTTASWWKKITAFF